MMKPERPPTNFETQVYDALQLIPRGKVTTYGLLAKYIGTGSPLAVGQALKRNPFAPEVPCHRVVAGDRSIGGYSGDRDGENIEKKLRLLRHEGVLFSSDGKVLPECLFAFEGS